MAELTVVFWRDVPAQVIVRAGRRTAKRQLPDRFQQAVDGAAMRSKAHGTDAYLAEWRRGAPHACGDDLDSEAAAAADRIDTDYDDDRLQRLIAAGGRESV